MIDRASELPLVYVVDDDDGLRDSVVCCLSSRRLPSRAFESAAAFELAIADESAAMGGISVWPGRPSCLILDLRMPEINGFAVFDSLLARGLTERLPVIFFSGHGDVDTAASTVKRGASYFLEKPFTADTLIREIDIALAASRKVLSQQDQADHWLSELTHRERETLYHALVGENSAAIAEKLGISARTVENFKLKAYPKLGVSSIVELSNEMRVRGVAFEALLSLPEHRCSKAKAAYEPSRPIPGDSGAANKDGP